MDYEELILNHYKKVANNSELEPSSTMADQYIRENELLFFLKEINRFINESGKVELKILDVGCGNGYLLSKIRTHYPKAQLYGIEFTPELLELAKSRNIKNCDIRWGDCRERSFFQENIDIVITERVVINIVNKRAQYRVLRNITDKLNRGGRYLMSESFQEPFVTLNQARKEMSLEVLFPSKHNKYLRESMVKYLSKINMAELDGGIPMNFLSTHFYLTRVYHEAIRPNGGKVKGSHFIDFMTEAIPPAIGSYSPILFRVFKKNGVNDES